jgi:hypothetical protein
MLCIFCELQPTPFEFQAAAAAAAGDQSRYVKLDWDILGAALESIGGLDPNHPTSVEVVSAEGESQQIIIQVHLQDWISNTSRIRPRMPFSFLRQILIFT